MRATSEERRGKDALFLRAGVSLTRSKINKMAKVESEDVIEEVPALEVRIQVMLIDGCDAVMVSSFASKALETPFN